MAEWRGGNMATTIDQQFVEYIIKSLVEHPDDVVVERTIDEQGVLLSLTVNPEDLGRVIGKRGVTAQSVRSLLRALGMKNSARYNFRIVNNDDQRENYTTTPDNKKVEPVEKVSEEPVENASDYAKTAREELAELDDLDI